MRGCGRSWKEPIRTWIEPGGEQENPRLFEPHPGMPALRRSGGGGGPPIETGQSRRARVYWALELAAGEGEQASPRRCLEKLAAYSSVARRRTGRPEWTVGDRGRAAFPGRIAGTLSERRHAASGEWIFILRDITESKRLEKEREAARRTQDLAQMAMLLAHEIRNPLGSLELFAGLLAEGTEDRPVLHEWVDQLRAGLRALSATVNNVLQFHSEPRSRTDAGEHRGAC